MKPVASPFRGALTLILLTLFLLPHLSQATTPDFQIIEPGLEYAKLTPKELGKTLHVLRVDLKNFSLQPIDARKLGSSVLSVKDMASKTKALAVINANFFDKTNRPLGLILKDGKILNGFHPTRWYAAILFSKNRAKITKAFKKSQIKGYPNGLQAGPRLVIWGKTPKLKNESSPKSAVGIDSKGRVLLIASTGNIEIGNLARYLAKPTSKGGLGLSNAMNLDGGSSTQLFIKAGNINENISGLNRVPVGLGVFKKPSN